MIGEGLWKPRKPKRAVVHQLRQRRACFGELVQIDGSPHDWFEERGPKCNLLVFVDDATGKLGELYFTPRESFFSYGEAARRYMARYGKPVAFYSDKHGIFRVNVKNPLSGTGLTQFGRAMKELDIEIICANTHKLKDGWNAPTKPYRIVWSRKCGCEEFLLWNKLINLLQNS